MGTAIKGTVYGTLMNFSCEHHALARQMHEVPYQGAPNAPVLFIKTANTFSHYGAPIGLPKTCPLVQVKASLGLIMGSTGSIAELILLNDLTVPHASFYRPPVKAKCIDGFLGIAHSTQKLTELHADLTMLDHLTVSVHINDQLVQSISLSQLVRKPRRLLSDVADFIDLQTGDVLMIGSPFDAPLAKAGDRMMISAPTFGSVLNTLVAAL